MDYIYDLKEKFEKELESMSKSGKLSVDAAYKLVAIVYRLCKMEKLAEEEYSHEGGTNYESGESYRRGRGANGRYISRDGGVSRENGMSRTGRGDDVYSNRRYSRHDGKEYMTEHLGKMMKDASPEEREALEIALEMLEDL